MTETLAIVIVTWNVRDLVLDALETLYADLAYSRLSARVVVVDSASTDGTPQAIRDSFPQVELIASTVNLGFARGNNVALAHLGYEQGKENPSLPSFVYLLNPDTRTELGATATLLKTLKQHPQVGVVGANLTYGDGSFQHGAFMFPGLKQLWAEFFPILGRWREGAFNGRYARHLYGQAVPFLVDFTLGATWLLRREVITQTGLFDEAFFMYCEEIDWAWRIQKQGWRIMTVPTAHVVHLGGQSTGQVKPSSTVYLWESRLRLYQKHYPRWKLWLAKGLIALGMTYLSRKTNDFALRDAYYAIRKQALRLWN